MIPKITNDGYGLMIRALDGDGIHFSAIVIGNGDAPDDYASLKQLVNPVLRIGIEASERKSANYYTLSGTVSNAEIENGFQFTEMGVFATNPNGGDDILYAYAHYSTSGYDAPSYIPSYKTCSFEITETVHVYVGDAEDVSAALVGSAYYATKSELSSHTGNHENPHNVTKQQVGLGNVENVSPANLAVKYTKASTLSELVSGEILSSVLSKVSASVSAVISHVGNNVLHITAAERAKWNGKAEGTHYHSATQINSGVLGVARGGTGGTTKDTAKFNLGLSGVGTYTRANGDLTTASADRHKSLTSVSLGAGVWVIICEAAAYSEITDFVCVSITKANMNNVAPNNFSCEAYGYGNLVGGGKVRVPFIYEAYSDTTLYMNIHSKYGMKWYGRIYAVRII